MATLQRRPEPGWLGAARCGVDASTGARPREAGARRGLRAAVTGELTVDFHAAMPGVIPPWTPLVERACPMVCRGGAAHRTALVSQRQWRRTGQLDIQSFVTSWGLSPPQVVEAHDIGTINAPAGCQTTAVVITWSRNGTRLAISTSGRASRSRDRTAELSRFAVGRSCADRRRTCVVPSPSSPAISKSGLACAGAQALRSTEWQCAPTVDPVSSIFGHSRS